MKSLWFFFFLFVAAHTVPGADETFPVLEVGSQVYSNVLVTGKNKTTVFIQHAHGIATLKVKELPAELAEELGYEVTEPKPKRGFDFSQQVAADPRVQEMQEKAVAQTEEFLKTITPVQLGLILGGAFLVYLFFCQCCRLVCLKSGHKPGPLIWLPILKWFPMLRAAGMSGWCFLLFLLPVVNLITHIVWCFKICNARQKSPLLGVLLLLPVTNILTFLYLAFSGGIEMEDAPPKLQFS